MIALITFDRLTGLLLVSRTLPRTSAFGYGSWIERFPETVRCEGPLCNRSADGCSVKNLLARWEIPEAF